FPVRALFVVDLVIALLAGLGATAWLGHVRAERSDERAIGAVALLLVTIVAADLWLAHMGQLPMDERTIWDRPSHLVQMALEENPDARIYTLDAFDLWARAYVAAEGLRKGFGPYRALAGVPIGNSVVLSGAVAADGYVNMLHDRVAAFWLTPNRRLLGPGPKAVGVPTARPGTLAPKFVNRLRKAAVTHVVSEKPLGSPFVLVASDGSVAAYRLESPFPRAYVASKWRSVASLAEAAAQVDSDDPAPAVEGLAAPASSEPSSIIAVRYRRPDNDALVVDVAGHGGMLVVAESYDEGWSVTVDGHRTPVLLANGYQRGVWVPEGSREVVFRYCPKGLMVGAVLSLTSVCFAAAWGVLAWRAPRESQFPRA
ncbi:MAG TPA: YfhO family protein, partial [Candidatus Binatia bacterium]|nr:YfhO family protein [Candidatus Binatia bacterium]